jgi:DNA-binding response OmpR family regulator
VTAGIQSPPPDSRALIADDDPTMLLLMEHVLAGLGRPFEAVADGAAAWRAWDASRHALVLLDIEMPGMDGLEVCRRIREADPQRTTFVIIVTGRDRAADLEAVLAAGADDYVTKPTTGQHLVARLRIALRRMDDDRARREAEEELRRARWFAGIGEATIAIQHEINNPLAGLMATAELMKYEAASKGQPLGDLAVIVEEAKRISALVKRMGDLRDAKSVEYTAGSRMIDLGKRD